LRGLLLNGEGGWLRFRRGERYRSRVELQTQTKYPEVDALCEVLGGSWFPGVEVVREEVL